VLFQVNKTLKEKNSNKLNRNLDDLKIEIGTSAKWKIKIKCLIIFQN
jgi:hypothetical protein